jgi:L-lactate dehydrogenase complex protein LldG
MERSAFLERLRTRLIGVTGPPLPDAFPGTPASGPADAAGAPDGAGENAVVRFLAALAAVGGRGAVVNTSGEDGRDPLAEAIATVAATIPEDERRAVVTPDAAAFDEAVDEALGWLGFAVSRPTSGPEWRAEAERAGLGVTSAVLGVTSTGSVLIGGGPDSPRAASILPRAHLVILPTDRLVPGLEQAIDVLGGMAATHASPFLVTGPSRTSDIEMQMVVGVHGPRAAHVLLIDES